MKTSNVFFLPFAVASVAVIAGCGVPEGPARDQWQITVATDAPVPQFGDRAIVEVLEQNGQTCNGCRHELSVAAASDWPFSFGVTPASDLADPRVRVRLYRTSDTGPDGPNSDRLIDTLVKLPAAQGVTDVFIQLQMSCFGVTADLEHDQSCDPESKMLAPLATAAAVPTKIEKAGTWGPAETKGCEGTPPDAGMKCIPGGAFLMGNPTYIPVGAGLDPVPEQLVQVSPFYMDDHEVTIGEIQPYLASLGLPLIGPGCTYREAEADPMAPVNCVTQAYATNACSHLGKRLPREAEWEWAASNREQESEYPWGEGGDPCDNSVVGRGLAGGTTSCLMSIHDVGGLVNGGNPRDLTTTGILNLGGNLSEWTSDKYLPYNDARCWGPAVRLLKDPTCAVGTLLSSRGGAWSDLPERAHSYQRNSGTDGQSPAFGFRCVWPIGPNSD